ncbi:MAG: hypothetical protein LAO77_12850 [Acidobacteriia bacterium]|nr:hypothetical protein [Terriglobia bacterium]
MATSATSANGNSSSLIVVNDTGGVTVIDPGTPLKRLNYFDGKFLRADDFDVEQQYLRQLVAQSNQGLGPGVVYGYDTTRGSGDSIHIGPGLAIDPSGRVLLLSSAVTQSISDLIERSKPTGAARADASGKSGPGTFTDCIDVSVATPIPPTVNAVSDVYVIAICAAEALCGQTDVFGKLCEEACVTTTDKKYRLDGVVLRAIPLSLLTPFPTSKVVDITANTYLRSKIAHSWFADEALRHQDSISRAGLLSSTWCLGAGYTSACCEVPLAVVARAGATTVFLDAWIVRRERMEAPSRRYWQWKMRMRPMDVFLAQILQFQCQLANLLGGDVVPAPAGIAVADATKNLVVLDETSAFLDEVRAGLSSYRTLSAAQAVTADQPALLALSLTKVTDLQDRLKRIIVTGKTPARPSSQILIRGGVIELPPAGYLPVYNHSNVTVNDQVRALLGDGLDLRFCVASADYIAHEVEAAQHMDRISLLQGLDDPSNKPRVDVFVPDGRAIAPPSPIDAYDAFARFSTRQTGGYSARGAAREETLASGGSALHTAAIGLAQGVIQKSQTLARQYAGAKARKTPLVLNSDLATNAFVAESRTTGALFYSKVDDATAEAQKYTTLANFAAAPKAAAARAHETLDGLWLTASSAQSITGLDRGQQTAVELRAILASRPAAPDTFELTFHGTLSISSVTRGANGGLLRGLLTGIYAFGVLKEEQAVQRTTEYLITERGSWPATVRWTGDDANGVIALDVEAPLTETEFFRLTRTVTNGSKIVYELALVQRSADTGGASSFALNTVTSVPIAALLLTPDRDVVNATNRNHRYAEAGLAVVQTALIVSDPNIKAMADAQLFPPPSTAPTELTIDAVRDWVMFTKRREKRCSPGVTPAAPLATRRYRVLNVTANAIDLADKVRSDFEANRTSTNREPLANWINALIAEKQREVSLVLTYAGGSTTADTDPDLSDWRSFHPGSVIYYAAIGAVGETDEMLELNRLISVESVLGGRSDKTQEVAIIPYPEAAAPADADGIMLLITLLQERKALVVFAAPADGGAHVLKAGTPTTQVTFSNNTLDAKAQAALAAKLPGTQPVSAVALAMTKDTPDTTAGLRLNAVPDALVAAGKAKAGVTQTVGSLSAQDREALIKLGKNPDDYDEVIFVES